MIRLSVPIGMAVTTAIWSSYEDKGGLDCPEMAYTYTFITTTVLSSIALLLVPFIRIGKQGSVSYECFDSCQSDKKMSGHPCTGSDNCSRPSKRWSLVDTVSQASSSSSFVMADQHQHQHRHHNCNGNCNNKSTTTPSSTTSCWSNRSTDGPPPRGGAMTDSSGRGSATSTRSLVRTPNPNRSDGGGGIVWVICEDCGTRKKQQRTHAEGSAHSAAPHAVGGDPARYFNDPTCGGTAAASSESSGRSPKAVGVRAGAAAAAVRPYPGRRRLPLVNREAMTYQMITRGFQP